MAAKTTSRPKITLRSTANTGTTYVTRKNRMTTSEKLRLRKYDPAIRRLVEFKEI